MLPIVCWQKVVDGTAYHYISLADVGDRTRNHYIIYFAVCKEIVRVRPLHWSTDQTHLNCPGRTTQPESAPSNRILRKRKRLLERMPAQTARLKRNRLLSEFCLLLCEGADDLKKGVEPLPDCWYLCRNGFNEQRKERSCRSVVLKSSKLLVDVSDRKKTETCRKKTLGVYFWTRDSTWARNKIGDILTYENVKKRQRDEVLWKFQTQSWQTRLGNTFFRHLDDFWCQVRSAIFFLKEALATRAVPSVAG